MPDDSDPRFEEIFGEDVFPDATATSVILDPTDVFDDDDQTSVGSHLDSGNGQPRFEGDASQLPADVCWTLQELVAAPHISEKSKKHWPVLLQYEHQLRSRLSELGLVLEISHEHRYAFTRQANDPSPHSRAILRTKTLSLAASTLLLYLYHQYLLSPADPVVDTADMIDHMAAYKRPDDTDDAAFVKKIKAAVRQLEVASIIKPIKGTSRYLVHAVITSIVTAEQVEALDQRYKALARGDIPEAASTDTDDDPESEEDNDA